MGAGRGNGWILLTLKEQQRFLKKKDGYRKYRLALETGEGAVGERQKRTTHCPWREQSKAKPGSGLQEKKSKPHTL